MTMLEFINYSVSLNNTSTSLIKDISFKLERAQTLGIVGESGSGKSLTALSALGLLNRRIFSIKGQVLVNTRNIFELTESDLNNIRGNEISMIFQEPMLSLNPVKDLQSQIYECAELSDKNLNHNDIKNSLNAVGLSNTNKILSSYPHMISGGQRQRFMIAMSILRKPNIMIADEPTTALDVTLQKQILDTLNNLKNDLNMSMLLISHDIEIIKKYCDHILVMKSGVIVENQPTNKIFIQPQHAYTKQLVNFKTSEFREEFLTKEDKVLETKSLSCKYLVKDLSLIHI